MALKAKEVRVEAAEKRAKAEKMLYSEEVEEALQNYMAHLRDAGMRLEERRRGAERVLWGYGVGREEGEEARKKERTMREIARVYAEMVREVGEVRRDVERLKGR